MTVTEGPRGPAIPAHVHERTYEAIYCLDGRLRVTVDGEEHLLTRGDFVSIPRRRRAHVRDGRAPDAVREHVRAGRASSASTSWRARSPSSASSPSAPSRSTATASRSGAAAGLDIAFVG